MYHYNFPINGFLSHPARLNLAQCFSQHYGWSNYAELKVAEIGGGGVGCCHCLWDLILEGQRLRQSGREAGLEYSVRECES